jgi:hypothetical protein
MAELNIVHLLMWWPHGSGGIGPAAKARRVEAILAWRANLPTIPHAIQELFQFGIARLGQWAQTRPDRQITYLDDDASRSSRGNRTRVPKTASAMRRRC